MTLKMETPDTCWGKLLADAMKSVGDATPLHEMVFFPDDLGLQDRFYDGYGLPEGEPFIAWSRTRVYFPVTYDGAEWVGSMPLSLEHVVRGEPRHVGGF